ncbi:uncharacterized protein Z518_01699 [Rhinocladiella mackenziei CBS 650.93]|uniref:Ras modification protein ERF4 n=1 Tax=Rhinocladiella mackenziei CBS 650.93 TaxID=1442369 RepID=A0A0D2JMD9_9EURO|nr:uncharacterized protein Z518_01699 [Rhinocladiella mackenziei CBS 650.93]KIX10615.1 hypothetical protein Z518_01699 [Rhinocladiella mackenziei CBS 650.93]
MDRLVEWCEVAQTEGKLVPVMVAPRQYNHLSPRALEKQPARDVFPPVASHTAHPADPSSSLTFPAHRPPVTEQDSSALTSTCPNPQAQRRSFLEALLVRQKKVIPPDNRSATSRVLNPINYVPRPTPVRVQPQPPHQRQTSADIGAGEVHTLLSLPEQRRSRQHSPTDPIVEHSPRLTPRAGDRTSIGLPPNQQRGNLPESSRSVGPMVESEKKEPNGLKEPDRALIPTSKYNTRERDLEAQQASSVLGPSYGVNPLDQPLQPPRRITSHRSLRRAQSAASIHSSAFARTNTDGRPPVSGSQEEVGQEYPGGDDGSVGEELAWGPSHPCFPHLNPHVPRNSREYAATRVIRIRRDWMVAGDLAPTYSNIYPEILDPLMQEQEFRYVIEHINQTLCQAYDPFSTWNWFDGLIGLVTGWFWEDFRPMGIKGHLKALDEWLEDWNHTVGARDGVKIIPLRRTGYMNLDIQIPDPQVRVVGDGDGESQQSPPTAPPPDTAGTQTKLP